ncbi:hypothetical protein GCM10008927_15310 [Amylibacter ulvae]|uniref:Rhamnogalacturonase A/B/Epimerase-like pectate lyase domain-containing protein n=1 Tax=Paramylibacter ulvae TaxID=1651968 RepID=A0ABQ3D0I9_9RHOB|nr:glycosyl hydrolase family 28-related protein [Amylibacter ulvae]GHA50983.1 hypothetical protein GCM10008927_15310 [Amylibacter ulvae]
MNKAVTDGINFTPAPFGDGLDMWSSVDGTPGSATYDGATNATLIAADADFGLCLEMQKTQGVQHLRYMGEIPMLPGCYLRVRVRIKAISGQMPSVRIAGWAGGAGGGHVSGVDETGPLTALSEYGKVETIEAIIGSGTRKGVDMVWGRDPIYGHFGIDLTGADGGVVRIEDISIEDVTSVFHRNMMDVVDVADYGAVGDGVTDNSSAFEAADADANGRDILVPAGTYYIAQTITMNNRIRFEGHLVMPDDAILQLAKNFNFNMYEDAFGDEEIAFKKAVQALFNYTDHEALDLNGRIVHLSGPIDVHGVIGNRDSFGTRKVIQNGELYASNNANWDIDTVVASASYDTDAPTTLTNVQNISSIQIGSHVAGNGVGREVYVRDVDVANNEITLSQALYRANANQNYTFTRFKYLLDFSGFDSMQRFVVDAIDFRCNQNASAILLPRDGKIFHVKDCFITSPKHRGITSAGNGCSGIMIDRCQFLSWEQNEAVADRVTIGFNVNANDAKIRDNRATRFMHFGVISGTGNIISGNHFFQGDNQGTSDRTAGMVFATKGFKSTFTGNYVDNCYLSWTNEHSPKPDDDGTSFGQLSVTGNVFTGSGTETWFSYIRVKPYGTGQYISGLSVTGNTFKQFGPVDIDRVEQVTTTFAQLDGSKTKNLIFADNQFARVNYVTQSPVNIEVSRSSNGAVWSADLGDYLPFGLPARHVTAVVPEGPVLGSSGAVYTMPYALTELGSNKSQISLNWSQAVHGKVRCEVRCDDPIQV